MPNITGYVLAFNSREDIPCYVSGAGGLASASSLNLAIIPLNSEGGRLIDIEWATPGSENGISITCFDYVRAPGIVKPRADAQKVITVQDSIGGGSYKRYLVPDAYTVADYAAGTAIPAVTIPNPIIFNADCTMAIPACPGCVYKGSVILPTLTLTNYIATGYGYDASGNALVFSPTTSTATTPTLLAAAMQTNWATLLGTGTFTASGQTISYTSTNGARLGFVITQS